MASASPDNPSKSESRLGSEGKNASGPSSPAASEATALAEARLGILAGGGDLPCRLAEACRVRQQSVFIVALKDQADPGWVSAYPHAWMRLGAAGSIIDRLQGEGVTHLVLAGHVRRPSLAALRPDWRGMRLLAGVSRRAFGDDSLLRAVIAELEAEGFQVVGAHEVLPDLLMPAGVLGSLHPDAEAEEDIARAAEIARELGRLDVGQGVVVQQGLVLGVEAIEGTDALLQRCGALKREGPGGVLVKLRKPQQEARADLPTLGVRTLEGAAKAGLRGIAAEAGGAVVIDQAAVVAAADRLQLFVVGITHDR